MLGIPGLRSNDGYTTIRIEALTTSCAVVVELQMWHRISVKITCDVKKEKEREDSFSPPHPDLIYLLFIIGLRKRE